MAALLVGKEPKGYPKLAALHVAAFEATTLALLDRGAGINVHSLVTHDGKTCLIWTATGGHDSVCQGPATARCDRP